MKALIFFLYRLLQWIALPAVALYLSLRALRQPGYGLRERLGGAPQRASRFRTQPGGIWLHAVSVGEVLSAVRFIKQLRERVPWCTVVVSVGTVAGRAMAESKLVGLADQVFYSPVDYVWCVRRVLRRVRPSLLIIFETEIWPNLWNETRKTGTELMVVNGRLSDRAWPRYQALRWFFAPLMALPRLILAQDDVSGRRYRELGAPAVKLVGNLKYDFDAQALTPPVDLAAFLSSLQPARIWIAASTMPPAVAGDPDEDAEVIRAFQHLSIEMPRLLLILVPRKPASFDEAARKLAAAAIRFARRSALGSDISLSLPGVLLLDSMGELSSLFSVADVVFMGGTLARCGGHNVLEPAFAAKPVVVGPHMENFAEIATALRASKAIVEIAAAGELAEMVGDILRNGDRDVGARALAVAKSGAGATIRAVGEAAALVGRAQPTIPAPWPLLAAAVLWRGGAMLHRWVYSSGMKTAATLARPVISIGGIAAGGSGKTPLAIWLGAELLKQGVRPGFLTRGYHRIASDDVTVIARGGTLEPAQSGDEAQILIRSKLGAVGISADRAAAARRILASPDPPDMFVLDDGFQHHSLHRDFDLVTVDALDPFAGGRALPAGRLREPVTSLTRAMAIVLTRCDPGRDYRPLHAEIRHWNAKAPIFHARNCSAGWRNLMGEPAELTGTALGFCGLGNPSSFWQTLEERGVRLVAQREFADHHRYRADELRLLRSEAEAQGAKSLLTTEKDVMNLPPDAAALLAPVQVLWLKLNVEVENGAELVALVLRTIRAKTNG